MPRLTLRIDFDQDRAVGPGKIKLLELIDNLGSIQLFIAILTRSRDLR
jgi:molybdenum-dependent DNA-binding transcriptional regulator ModE